MVDFLTPFLGLFCCLLLAQPTGGAIDDDAPSYLQGAIDIGAL